MYKLSNLWSNQVVGAFDRWSSTYTETAEKKIHDRGYSYEFLGNFIWEQLGQPETGTLVEFGTGTGVLGRRIPLRPGVELVGLDISSKMLLQVPFGIYSTTVQCSAESVPLPSESAVGVYAAFMLHSVHNRRRAIQEMRRILVPGGIGVIVDLFPSADGLPGLNRVLRFFHSMVHESGAPANYVTVDHLHQELRRDSLEIDHAEEIGLPKSYAHMAVTFRKPNDA